MSDEESPPEHPTKELVAPTKDEIFHAEMRLFMGDVRLAIGRLRDDVVDMSARVGRVEGRQDLLESRTSTHSMRVRENSQQDLTQDAAIAAEVIARTDLAKKVDALVVKTDAQTVILAKLEKLFDKPAVKLVAGAAIWLVYQYLKTKGAPLP